MKSALTTLFCFAMACVSSACNFASLNEPMKMSRAELQRQQHGRSNESAFRPISSAPGSRTGG
jgi:hypothetical protein